ncbi:7161_t:CDS:2 [Ambispora gerdemannii]|uniref:7161_t:CDS:1 n=1 Tax=Ambispora gerdemannii TaxID=144530 RepID=A0A9N8V1Z1_9GLOM|nr:7161_t:CDS:2 [Ambispora gerdemannii]
MTNNNIALTTNSETQGLLNRLAKSFLEEIDRGSSWEKIEQEINEYLKSNKIHPRTLLDLLSSQSYKRQFKVLLGFCFEREIGYADKQAAFASYKTASYLDAQNELEELYQIVMAHLNQELGVSPMSTSSEDDSPKIITHTPRRRKNKKKMSSRC